jgi:hypothetical protein
LKRDGARSPASLISPVFHTHFLLNLNCHVPCGSWPDLHPKGS